MSFSNKEQGVVKEALLPSARDIDALVRAEHQDPFSILGPHGDGAGGQFIRAYLPGALSVAVLDKDSGEELGPLEMTETPGLFVGHFDQARPYLLRTRWAGGEQVAEDPYSFGQLLGEMDLYLFAEGNHRDLSACLGAQLKTVDGVDGVRLPCGHRMPAVSRWSAISTSGTAVATQCGCVIRPVSGNCSSRVCKRGSCISTKSSAPTAFCRSRPTRWHWPPACRRTPLRKLPRPAMIDWQDHDWMNSRRDRQQRSKPLSIYELPAGSWQCELDDLGEVARQYTWPELAERLIPYVKELGFTHIELMPIMEHPFGGSWGYQLLSQFAPSARYGTPDQFAEFVNACHQADIGVILDWVPAHFPTDTHGLAQFDGTALYEYGNPLEGFHQDWDTLIYNLGRTEVHGYMLASALHWLKHFHIDGLRVDAVASMLYRDYSRKAGEWVPNRHGGRENLEAIDFLRHLNDVVELEAPGALVIAEESTAWPGVSQSAQQGGLGFAYKWNMGWMHDSLHYIQQDPVYRAHHHNELSFGLVYAWSERFILPISHDEVVHGKHSLIDKMPGDRWQKFANLRAYLSFMWTHPGKKLLFMGCEFGQWREWNHDQQLDWYLLRYSEHKGVQKLVGDLNRLYREEPALHDQDDAPQGFQWLIGDDAINSVYAWLRWSVDGSPVLVVANFTPVPRQAYRVGVPFAGRWTELFNSDADIYAGSNYGNGGGALTEEVPSHGQSLSLELNLPPLAVLIFRPQG